MQRGAEATRPTGWLGTAALIVTAAAAVAVAVGGLVMWLLVMPGRLRSGPVVVTVRSGESFRATARRMAEAGLVRYPRLLAAWASATGKDREVKWGEFLFTGPVSPIAALDRLTRPPDPLHEVTIPEGLSVRQTVHLLAAHGFGTAESLLCHLRDPAFLAALDLPATGAEGYLFPDTYAFPLLTPQKFILRRMVERFRQVFTPEMAARAADQGLRVREAVILASIIEKETARADERRLVSAVFHNRLRLGMPLQSDPTVIYALPGLDGALTRKDLATPSPFNTYTNRGLPPAPIANPGRAALEAAVNPAPVDYLYFVARGDGTHQFSVTLAEHIRAVAR